MKTPTWHLLAPSLTLAAVMATSSGCAGARSVNKLTVTGTVTYDGKPVEKGVIVFIFGEISFRGGANATGFVKDGKFSVSAVSRGRNCVIVAASEASTGGGTAGPGSVTMADAPKMPDARKGEDYMKTFMPPPPKIPLDAPGNSQTFDIGGQDGTTLDLKILKK